MEKVIWGLWGRRAVDRSTLRDLLVARLAPALLDEPSVLGLALAVDDPEAEVDAPVPYPDDEDPLLALVSVWLPAYDHRSAVEDRITAAAAELDLTAHGYLVSESLYSDYGDTPWAGPRDWPDGERSPGVLTVGLLQRPPGHDRTAWVRHWHDVQSPESGELQPRTRYVRNLVALALDDGPPLEGIVLEGWPSNEHVRDPDLFYRGEGDPDRVAAHVERMLANVTAFLDLGTFRAATMGEYLFRSPSGP